MKHFIRSIFRIRIFENVLVFFLEKFPNSFLRLLVSSNSSYPLGSMRLCKRYGVYYDLNINDYQNWLLYFYSSNDSSFGVLKYIREGDTVIDVGGNIGQTALMMAQKAGDQCMIYAFEPYPDTYKRFKKNLSLNQSLSSRIQLENTALGSAPCKLYMYEDCSTNSGANRMLPVNADAASASIEVPVTLLDSFVAEKNIAKINLVKIDVEGFEMEVLKGSERTLLGFGPDLFIEVDDNNLKKQKSSAEALCTYLADFGYSIYDENGAAIINFQAIHQPLNIYCKRKVNSK